MVTTISLAYVCKMVYSQNLHKFLSNYLADDEAARAYVSPVNRNDVKTLAGLAVKELYPKQDAA